MIEEITKYRVHDLVELRQIAADNNCELFVCGKNEIAVDIDTVEQEAQFASMQSLIKEQYHIVATNFWASRGDGKHFVLTFDRDLDPMERIILQSVLGSDPKREFLALWELSQGFEESVLFKPLRDEVQREKGQGSDH